MRTLIALALLVAAPLAAQTADIAGFGDRILREFPDVPGIGLAVVKDGRPLLVRGFGKGIGADTTFYTGSLTKSYTGLLCAVLAQRGLLDLDAPVTKYLPEVTLPKPATLRQFLTHTSGVANEPIAFRTAYVGDASTAEVIRLLSFSTASKDEFHYDNLGYIVAGAVIERVTGKPWQRALREVVLEPLGLRATKTTISDARRLAKAYDLDDRGAMSPAPLHKTDATMHAAGGTVTTPRDVAKWMLANLERAKLPRAAYDEAQRAQVAVTSEWRRFHRTGYGFGWYVGTFEGERIVQHFGDYTGWKAHVTLLPEKRIGVAVLINTGGLGSALADVYSAYVLDVLLGRTPADDLPATRERLEKLRANWVAEIARRATRPPSLTRPASAYTGTFTSELYGTLRIAETPRGLEASMGPLRSLLAPSTQPDVARVELVPGSGEPMRFVFDEAGHVTVRWHGATFRP